MKNTILPPVILLICLPLSAYSFSYIDDVKLAKQCHNVAKKIAKIAVKQTRSKCSKYTSIASKEASIAGPELIVQHYKSASSHLKIAISNLQSAQVKGCKKQDSITKAKLEVIAINNQIID